MGIVETLVKSNFAATEAQVEALARDVTHGQTADGTYLKVLVVACQGEMSTTGRKPSPTRQKVVINKVHVRFYAAVMKGVGGEDNKERTRRATFARTAASTLRTFVTNGGDVRSLDVADVTKTKLRLEGVEVPAGTRVERSFQRSADALLRAAKRIVKMDPARIEAAIEALRELLPGDDTDVRVVRSIRLPRNGSVVHSASH